MRAFHASERVAVQRKTVWINISAAETGAWSEHDHAGLAIAAYTVSFADTAVIAVIADDDGNDAARSLFESVAIVFIEIPTLETFRQIS